MPGPLEPTHTQCAGPRPSALQNHGLAGRQYASESVQQTRKMTEDPIGDFLTKSNCRDSGGNHKSENEYSQCEGRPV